VQVFENLKAVAEAAGGSFKDIVKLNIFLTDLSHFAKVNEIMGRYFQLEACSLKLLFFPKEFP
jgi:enamine deaminase RidA (YjgF/YER057c/UK114 family)